MKTLTAINRLVRGGLPVRTRTRLLKIIVKNHERRIRALEAALATKRTSTP